MITKVFGAIPSLGRIRHKLYFQTITKTRPENCRNIFFHFRDCFYCDSVWVRECDGFAPEVFEGLLFRYLLRKNNQSMTFSNDLTNALWINWIILKRLNLIWESIDGQARFFRTLQPTFGQSWRHWRRNGSRVPDTAIHDQPIVRLRPNEPANA